MEVYLKKYPTLIKSKFTDKNFIKFMANAFLH